MKALSGERDALDEQLELRKLLDRAKVLLIYQHSLTEQAAFDFIQKGAMSSRLRMKDVEQRVIDGDLTPN